MDEILKDLNCRFDHAALKPDVDEKGLIKLCDEARQYDLFAVCVNPVWVKTVRGLLLGSSIRIAATAGFPLGANRTDIKATEAAKAVQDGASEIDMVANIGRIKSGDFKAVEREITEVRKSIPFNVLLKVIIEAPLLTRLEQIEATKAVIAGGAQFVKTGTGFFGDATVEQIKTLYEEAQRKIEIKAAGGIKTVEQCLRFIETGATRLGSSSCVRIMQELRRSDSAKTD